MVESSTIYIILDILGVLGTWLGVYIAYRAIKKNNTLSISRIENSINSYINSGNNLFKKNVQIGKQNKNVQ